MRQDLHSQVDFYNHLWQDFKYANIYKLTRCTAILDAIRSTQLDEPRILDLGCGAGWLSAVLGVFGPTVGIDLSENAILSARSRYLHVQFVASNIFEWEFPRSAFDVVVSQEVIEHVADQADYLRIAWEALRPGGYLILTTPNKATLLAMPDEQMKTWSTQPIENWLSIRDLKRLVAQRFRISHIQTVIPGLGHRGLRRLFNSTRIENLMENMRVTPFYDRLRLSIGLGLHVVVLAQKQDDGNST